MPATKHWIRRGALRSALHHFFRLIETMIRARKLGTVGCVIRPCQSEVFPAPQGLPSPGWLGGRMAGADFAICTDDSLNLEHHRARCFYGVMRGSIPPGFPVVKGAWPDQGPFDLDRGCAMAIGFALEPRRIDRLWPVAHWRTGGVA